MEKGGMSSWLYKTITSGFVACILAGSVTGTVSASASVRNAKDIWPSIIDETTGRRVYQLTSRPGNNMAFYYLFKNQGSVDGVPYLAYRNTYTNGVSYYSINMNTGKEVELTQRGMVGTIADVVGEYLYCLKKAEASDPTYSYIIRSNLKTGVEETIINLDAGPNYSANLTVSADGKKVLFFSVEKGAGINLFCGDVETGGKRAVAAGKMSHLEFGPVNPDLYIYLNQDYKMEWKRNGFGWVDLTLGFITNASLDTADSFFRENDGQRVSAHLFWTADGLPVITATDTRPPYVQDYNITVVPDKKHPGELLEYKKVKIKMGQFQTHLNPGPTAEWFVGDGRAADWWHKPGYGKPYIHKVRFDYEREEMVQIPLADQVGAYWKSGSYEPCARYVPGRDMVVWDSFRTLDGKIPSFITEEQRETGAWDERSEPAGLYGSANDVKQNVFAVFFSREDASGWDFSADTEGWTGDRILLDWSFGGVEDACITGAITAEGAALISPDHIGLSCAEYDRLMIRLKNKSLATRCKVYFTTEDNSLFSESRMAEIEIPAMMDDFQSFFVDLSMVPGWTGSLRQIKIAPAADADAGLFSIQVIRFIQEL